MTNNIQNIWNKIFRRDQRERPESAQNVIFPKSEKIVALLISVIIALGLWLVVNLGKEYTLSVDMPLNISSVDQDYALAEPPPDYITVTLFGEGWNLLNIYSNPPEISLNPDSERIDFFEVVQQQTRVFQDVSVQSVEPSGLTLQIEERMSRKLPVVPNVDFSFRRQYNFTEEPKIMPDSVTIYGARSLVESYSELPTKSYQFSDINENIEEELELDSINHLLEFDQSSVTLQGSVDEYTEEEVRVSIQVRDKPEDSDIRFSPSSVTVTFRVPLDQYELLDDTDPFEAYVYYSDLEEDRTGSVRPHVSQINSELNLLIRNIQPRSINYYMVVDE